MRLMKKFITITLALLIITFIRMPFLLAESSKEIGSHFRQNYDYGYYCLKDFKHENKPKFYKFARFYGERPVVYEFDTGKKRLGMKPNHIILDSAFCLYRPSMCDTNAVYYFTKDEDSTRLIVTVMSPIVYRDTILSYLSDSKENWLNDWFVFFFIYYK